MCQEARDSLLGRLLGATMGSREPGAEGSLKLRLTVNEGAATFLKGAATCVAFMAPIKGQPEACRRFLESGGVFKLEFGPKAFIVVSDPVVARHLLKVGASMQPRATRVLGGRVLWKRSKRFVTSSVSGASRLLG